MHLPIYLASVQIEGIHTHVTDPLPRRVAIFLTKKYMRLMIMTGRLGFVLNVLLYHYMNLTILLAAQPPRQ